MFAAAGKCSELKWSENDPNGRQRKWTEVKWKFSQQPVNVVNWSEEKFYTTASKYRELKRSQNNPNGRQV